MQSNLRRVKLLNEGFYSIETKPMQAQSGRLCDYCGKLDTCEVMSFAKAYEPGIILSPRRCTSYMPIISFRPPLEGFEGVYNTIRLGKAWANRVHIGKEVGLFDVSTCRLFGIANVVRSTTATMAELKSRHAQHNHLTKSMSDPGGEIKGVLSRMYGGGFVSNASAFSVIYLETVELK